MPFRDNSATDYNYIKTVIIDLTEIYILGLTITRSEEWEGVLLASAEAILFRAKKKYKMLRTSLKLIFFPGNIISVSLSILLKNSDIARNMKIEKNYHSPGEQPFLIWKHQIVAYWACQVRMMSYLGGGGGSFSKLELSWLG